MFERCEKRQTLLDLRGESADTVVTNPSHIVENVVYFRLGFVTKRGEDGVPHACTPLAPATLWLVLTRRLA